MYYDIGIIILIILVSLIIYLIGYGRGRYNGAHDYANYIEKAQQAFKHEKKKQEIINATKKNLQ